MCDFEKKVLQNLKDLNIPLNQNVKIGVAVSGGADSVSLLMCLSNLLSDYNLPVYVITVNHNIRSEEETCGDAIFVKNLCSQMADSGKNVIFDEYSIERGKINKEAQQRKCGIEESARYYRYKCFEEFISKYEIDYLCLAHNQNDQLETILMRFIKGSSLEALCGIKSKRNKYIRPLLNIKRSEIEEYLEGKNVTWRTDSTNLETSYLRNKIRLKLIPLLDNEFSGWEKSVQNATRHFEEDGELILHKVNEFKIENSSNEVVFNIDDFLKEAKCVQLRIIKKAANLAGEESRISSDFVEDVIKSLNQNGENSYSKCFNNIEINVKKNRVFVKKRPKSHTEITFFGIIEECGEYDFPFGKLSLIKENDCSPLTVQINGSPIELNMAFPFIVRNIQLDDEIQMADGKMKKISDVYSDWHVSDEDKNIIPVFQEFTEKNQNIRCIAGSFLGYKDWIVRI